MKLTITEEMINNAKAESKNYTKSRCCPVAQSLISKGHQREKIVAGCDCLYIQDLCYNYSQELKVQVHNYDRKQEFEPGIYMVTKVKQ